MQKSQSANLAPIWIASTLWVADAIGAVAFAACLSLFIGSLVGEIGSMSQTYILAGLILSGLWRASVQGGAIIRGQSAANAVKSDHRMALFSTLLPSAMQRGRIVGEDMRVAIDDVEAGEAMVARFQPLRQAAVLSPFVIALAVAMASWFSALILLLTLIPFALGMALAGYAGKAEAERQMYALSRLSGLFVDRVTHLPLILTNGAEDRVTRQMGTAAHDVATRTMAVLRIAFISSAVMEFFAALSVALVAVYCGFSLLGLLPFPAPESLSLSRAFFALALAPEFYLGMRRMAAAYHDKQQGEASQASIESALAQAAAFPLTPRTAPHRKAPRIQLDNVVIVYADRTAVGPFHAEWQGPGLHILSGDTGSGKSSLLHALIGLTPERQGVIRIDGAAITGDALAQQVGWAGQRPLLLPGTLQDNLILGSTTNNLEVLAPIIEATGLSNLIAMRGADLFIDARGSGLSGGERRRIGLVRAIASGRPLLMLDEPTADLDDETAEAIVSLLSDLARERMVIAATHDARLIARADSVMVLS